ncbi:MAG: hypothetical protein HKN80_13800 [Acidimicrobiia bacterium]|nr:hypothetical protein [Acidimicrobiia bacterium]
MAPISRPTRPVIVCGVARSGTTRLGELLSELDDVVIFPEMDPTHVPAQFDLLRQLRATFQAQTWRIEFTPEGIDARLVELLRRIWGAGRVTSEPRDDVGQLRFGLKQPHAEERHVEFTEVLGQYRPVYVYTVREPGAIYHSTLRMAAFGDYQPDEYADRFLQSVDIASKLAGEGDLMVFDVAEAAGDPRYRTRRAQDVLTFIGLRSNDRYRNQVERWPLVNESGGKNRGPIADEEIQRRVAAFRRDPRYGELQERIVALKSTRSG